MAALPRAPAVAALFWSTVVPHCLACVNPKQMEGREVVTLEGIPEGMRQVLGEAFVSEGGVQCGYCIPGILVRASSMIRQGSPTIAKLWRRRFPDICAAARGTRELSTGFKPLAKPGRMAEAFRAKSRGAISFLAKNIGLAPQSERSSIAGNGIGQYPSRYHGFDQAFGEQALC